MPPRIAYNQNNRNFHRWSSMSNECQSGYISNSMALKKPLTPEAEASYAVKAKQGDKSAANILVEHNLRLVAHITKKYACLNYPQDDLMSIGTIGLIKAVNSFDVDKGIKLGTYAVRCIEKGILTIVPLFELGTLRVIFKKGNYCKNFH